MVIGKKRTKGMRRGREGTDVFLAERRDKQGNSVSEGREGEAQWCPSGNTSYPSYSLTPLCLAPVFVVLVFPVVLSFSLGKGEKKRKCGMTRNALFLERKREVRRGDREE